MCVDLESAPEALWMQALRDAFADESIGQHLAAGFMQPGQPHLPVRTAQHIKRVQLWVGMLQSGTTVALAASVCKRVFVYVCCCC